jgi:AcrR family transcriptional regulator
VAAAREVFATESYEGASVRRIASRAGVDPALVLHYFGSKDGLFDAAMTPPVDPRELERRVFGPGLEGAGARLAAVFLGLWESDDAGTQVRGLVRAAVSHEDAARRLKAFVEREIVEMAVRNLGAGGRLRLELAASHLVGLAFARYIVGVEPLASTPRDAVVEIIGPVLQRYMDESLPVGDGKETHR